MTTSRLLFVVVVISAPAIWNGNRFLGLWFLFDAFSRRAPGSTSLENALGSKRKGLQLALEPLNGRGIAGYVPKP
jgi:hypothetical protein